MVSVILLHMMYQSVFKADLSFLARTACKKNKIKRHLLETLLEKCHIFMMVCAEELNESERKQLPG